ncbi:MAG: VTT domain-containing protein [Kiritimatiellae bacterium]|nr:VTT domain-containing protein [Kiritimatiellia bacterium]
MNNAKNFKSMAIWAILITIVLIPFFIFEESVNNRINVLISENGGSTFALAAILFAVLASDIFLPVPSCLLSAMCGAFLGPVLGFIVSFAAMSVSGVIGFFIGSTASSLARRLISDNEKSLKSNAKSGPFMLFILRPVPVLAECSCVYAGLRRYNFAKCVVWLSVGNAVISAVYAVIGHFGRANDSFVPAFAAVVVLSGIGFLFGKTSNGKIKTES